MNFTDEVGSFDSTIVEDNSFKLFGGYEKGPCEKEQLVNGAATNARDTVKASPGQFAMGRAPEDPRSHYSPAAKQQPYPYPDNWKEPVPAGGTQLYPKVPST